MDAKKFLDDVLKGVDTGEAESDSESESITEKETESEPTEK
jgi:hypothetical protein